MKLANYPRPYVEALCTWQALRQLGFESDDIYFKIGGLLLDVDEHELGYVIFIIIKAQNKEFSINAGVVQGLPQDIEDTWVAIATALNGKEIEDMEECYYSSCIKAQAEPLLLALQERGFVLPMSLN